MKAPMLFFVLSCNFFFRLGAQHESGWRITGIFFGTVHSRWTGSVRLGDPLEGDKGRPDEASEDKRPGLPNGGEMGRKACLRRRWATRAHG
ncbi:hypothetical protein V8C35DRAFT_306306 [Trichoderma chlorosporum]